MGNKSTLWVNTVAVWALRSIVLILVFINFHNQSTDKLNWRPIIPIYLIIIW